jgi:hypothetical protein
MLNPMRPIGCGALVVGVLVAWGSSATGSVPANDATVHTLRGRTPFTGDEQLGLTNPVLRAPSSSASARLVLQAPRLSVPSARTQQGGWLRLTFKPRDYVLGFGAMGAAWLFPTINGGAWFGRLLIRF